MYFQNLASQKCLEVEGTPGNTHGDNVQLNPCEDMSSTVTDHVWMIDDEGRIRNRASNYNMCLDVDGPADPGQ